MAERPGHYDHPPVPPPDHLDHQPPAVPQHHQPFQQPQQHPPHLAFEQQQQHQQPHQQQQQQQPQSQQSFTSQQGSSSPQQQPHYPPLSSAASRPKSHQRSSTSGSGSKGRTFSLQSGKSHHSSGSKDGLHETHEEKEAHRLHSKADPSLAISEAEPSVVATMTQSSLAPLRSIQHKDTLGNPIADPDRSNPTRNRWERPLDTIRSFEAAIDGGYSRKSLYRNESDGPMPWQNRRASYHHGPQNQEPRFQRDSYYSQRPVSHQFNHHAGHDGQPGPSRARNSYYDSQQQGYQGYPRQRLSRMQTEPPHHPHARAQNIYPMPHNDRSYETVTSAAASGNSDQAGYQTDPTSSDSSSVERRSPAKLQPPNDYGIGFNQSPSYQSPNLGLAAPQQQQQQQQQYPPPQPPPKNGASLLRKQVSPPQVAPEPVAQPEKRKSWLSRRFSKNK